MRLRVVHSFLLFFGAVAMVLGQTALPTKIPIGAIFEQGDEAHIQIMKRAIDRINNGNMFTKVELTLEHFIVKPNDSFQAAKKLCHLFRLQVWTIISSRSESIAWYARSLADQFNIPHLTYHWDHRSPFKYNINQPEELRHNESLTINLYPENHQLSKAFVDLIQARNLKSVTLVYDSDAGLIQLKNLMGISNDPDKRKIKTNINKFISPVKHDHNGDPVDDGDSIQMRKIIKTFRRTERNLVISMSNERVIKFLREARAVGRMTEYDNFIIASLDFHNLDLSEFEGTTVANITGLTMLNPSGQPLDLVNEEIVLMNSFRRGSSSFPRPRISILGTTEALIYDAVTLLAQTLFELDREMPQEVTEPFVDCDQNDQPWPFGLKIARQMKMSQMAGVSGPIRFDKFGHRINFALDVLQLKVDGLKNVAKWTMQDGVISSANYTFYDSYKQILEAMKTKEFRVTVPPTSKPYVYLKENHEELEGNDKFEGFCVDLLNLIVTVFREDFQSDFRYSIKIVDDLKYGRPDKETGDWDGMLGELMRHQSDIAMADLTATYLRETAVDFTMPFMNLGIAILFKKPTYPEPELFSFLKPFSTEVWFYLGSAYLGVSLLLWLVSRISPYEWIPPHSCDPEPLELVNQFSIGNALWFAIGSLMQQGSDLGPRALSTRTLASVWWFFVLILISSYTANLAASLTLSMMSPAISNVEDLAKQTAIMYGCKRGGSTYEFFQNSNHSTFQRMFNYMETNPEVYIDKMDDAIERVRKGGYAYLAESSTIEYLVQRQCDLTQVGTWLDNKGYGLATPADSPYRTPISNAIVVLQDRGMLYKLKRKWWEEKGGGLCPGETKVSLDLDISSIGGVFMVLAAGVTIGVFCGLLEFVWKAMKVARHERPSIPRLIWLEVVRICTGGGSSRPVMSAAGSRVVLNEGEGREQSKTPGLRRIESQESSMSANVQGVGRQQQQPYQRQNIPLREFENPVYDQYSPVDNEKFDSPSYTPNKMFKRQVF